MSRSSVSDLSSQSHFQQPVAQTSRKLNAFAALLGTTNDTLHRRRRFRFIVRSLFCRAPPIFSSGMEHLPFSAYIRNTHGIFMMPALFLVIKYALTKSVINNKNPTKICPKSKFSRRQSQDTHHPGERDDNTSSRHLS